MAFATTNTQSGAIGSLKFYAGDWSGAIGDANGTVTLNGGRVYLANFCNCDNTSQEDRPTPVTVSESAGTITVSVSNQNAVTTGRFLIVYS